MLRSVFDRLRCVTRQPWTTESRHFGTASEATVTVKQDSEQAVSPDRPYTEWTEPATRLQQASKTLQGWVSLIPLRTRPERVLASIIPEVVGRFRDTRQLPTGMDV